MFLEDTSVKEKVLDKLLFELVLNSERGKKRRCLDPFSQEIKQFFHTSLGKNKAFTILSFVTFFAMFSRVTSLTFTEILFVCISVQASRIMKTRVTEARVILMRRKDTSLSLFI